MGRDYHAYGSAPEPEPEVIDEVVGDGSTTSRIDPLTVGDFLLPEREYIKKTAAAIEEVICRTERHGHGITYKVVMALAPDDPYDDQPDYNGEYEVWQRFVRFGSTEASRAGGYLFRVAAQDQEAIGAFVWRAMAAVQLLPQPDPNDPQAVGCAGFIPSPTGDERLCGLCGYPESEHGGFRWAHCPELDPR